jgi:hypothetical protein
MAVEGSRGGMECRLVGEGSVVVLGMVCVEECGSMLGVSMKRTFG